MRFVAGLNTLVFAFGCSLIDAAWAQNKPAGVPGQPMDALSTAVKNLGLSCGEGLERLSRLAINGTRQHDILLDWDRKRPAGSPVFALIAGEYTNGSAVMSISALPDPKGARPCTLLAERVTTAPYPCAAVAQQELPNQRPVQLLPRMTVYTDPSDATATVSMIETPPGCLIIRRYVEFNWQASPP